MKLIGLFVFGFIILHTVNGQQKKIYIAPDDHTDYMWSADEAGYRKAFLETLDYYLKLNDSTANDPYPFQSKWNCDGSYWIYEYQRNRTPLQFSKLIGQIKDGRITVPLNTLPELLGIAPLEATLRDMYYAGSLERKYGLDLDLVINMEDQVLPLGLSSLWAGSGAKYSWRGVCNCATKVTGLDARPHEIYWYKGLDEQKILMKWYSLPGDNKQLGGYAEARDPGKSIQLCKDLINSAKYPYQIAGAFGQGWDDIKTTSTDFITAARKYSDPEYQVIVSDETDFFKDFEKQYGSILPSETVSYGSSEWGNSLASLADVSADIKRSVEKLRTAEALYTFAALKDKKFGTALTDIREKAWISCGLYFDHDWTADGTVISKKQRAEWARKIAAQLSRYVDTLYDLSLNQLGDMVSLNRKVNNSFFVFNQLSWMRTDYCDFPYSGQEAITVVDLISEEDIPFQFITKKNVRYLRILASDVPSLGYKTYGIFPSSRHTKNNQAATVTDSIIENSHYRIKFSRQGAILSLIDKNNRNRESVKPVKQLFANDIGSGNGDSGYPLRVENAGPVSVTLVAQSDTPIKHLSKITLFGFNDRIEIENYIMQNIGAEPVTYSFSLNLKDPEIWHEEAGAILLAKQQSEGGHYSDSICRLDWIGMNHFADISDGDNGIVISNRDAYFMKTGNSTIKKLDAKTPQINVLAVGQIDAPDLGIVNQNGDSYFENFFALKTNKNGFNAASSMRFSLEHQNPLVAGRISGKNGPYHSRFSLFETSDPDVLVWSLKPAEEGIESGVILRIWNLGNRDRECTISSPYQIVKCFKTSHIETNISEIIPDGDVLKINAGHNRLETYRVFLK